MQAIKKPLMLSLTLFLILSVTTISLYAIQNNYHGNSIIAMAENN